MKEQCNKLIREKLPHLQELTLGCRVKSEKGIGIALSKGDEQYNFLLPNGWIGAEEHLGAFEILGHPIQINDWLGLLGEDYATDGKGYVIYKGGAILGYQWSDKDEKIQYDLSKPFDSQSEAFYEWLYNELK